MKEQMLLLLCVDGSENSNRAAHYAAKLVCGTETSITLLHVVSEKEAMENIDDSKEVGREAIEYRIQYAIDELEKADIDFSESIQIGNPSEVIIEMATRYDGIVMGYKGHGMIETLFMGSVTEKVMRESKKPIILVP